MSESPKVTEMAIEELLPDQKNARRQTERSAFMQAESMHRFGAARSIVIDEENTILAGNGATQAAADMGIKKVIVVPADGKTLVAVQRTDLSEGQKKEYAIADNRTSDLSEWDPLQLAQLNLDAEVELTNWFRDDELEKLIMTPDIEPEETEPPEDDYEVSCPSCGHTFKPEAKK